jgi:SulP family sulfate permease
LLVPKLVTTLKTYNQAQFAADITAGVIVIRMRNVPAIDSTAMPALRDLLRRTWRDGTLVLFSDVQSQPLAALKRSELLDEIGEKNLFGNIDEALAAATATEQRGSEK